MGNSKKKETKIFCGNGMIYCWFYDLPNYDDLLIHTTGSSCLMRISLLRISLLQFFKTITKIWLMRFYRLFILLLRT